MFLKKDEGNNTYSFHAVDLNINSMVLKPDTQGIYYKHAFVGDSYVENQVVAYGVALSITAEPTEADLLATKNLEAEECVVKGDGVVLTRFTGDFGSSSGTSTLVTNIMKDTAGYTTNRRNANKPIYGRAYALLADGTYVMGVTRDLSLRDLVEEFDSGWASLNQNARNSLVKAYKNDVFKKVMQYWTIPNIKEPTQTEEDQSILRVLAIGNSHTGDATSMLAAVFAAEDPDQEIMVGNLYHSGCTVANHVKYAKNNSLEYVYYKNVDGTWTPSLQTSSKNATVKDALLDQAWDVVILHEMNRNVVLDSTYTGTNYQDLIDYVNKYSLNKPTFLWNLSWANPTDADLLAQGDKVSSSWTSGYQSSSNLDYNTMFTQMVNNTKNKVMTNEAFTGMAPTGTAVCYARNVKGLTDKELYRDYTHMSDLGRLISGYVWYATLTGKTEITDVNVGSISKALCAQNKSSGFTVTDDMKQIIKDSVNYALANPYSVPTGN